MATWTPNPEPAPLRHARAAQTTGGGQQPTRSIQRISGAVDEIELPAYGTHTHYVAAEIVDDHGHITLVFREPHARYYGPWSRHDEDNWRSDVRRFATSEPSYRHATIVWDPYRDRTQEEPIPS